MFLSNFLFARFGQEMITMTWFHKYHQKCRIHIISRRQLNGPKFANNYLVISLL